MLECLAANNMETKLCLYISNCQSFFRIPNARKYLLMQTDSLAALKRATGLRIKPCIWFICTSTVYTNMNFMGELKAWLPSQLYKIYYMLYIIIINIHIMWKLFFAGYFIHLQKRELKALQVTFLAFSWFQLQIFK